MDKKLEIETKFDKLIFDKNEEISGLRELLEKSYKELAEIKTERLKELGILKDETVVKEFGYKLQMGQGFSIVGDNVPDEFRYKTGKKEIKFGDIRINDNFNIIIMGESNLRYNIRIELSDMSQASILVPNGRGGYYNGYATNMSMNKDKLLNFLTKSNTKLMRNHKLRELGI